MRKRNGSKKDYESKPSNFLFIHKCSKSELNNSNCLRKIGIDTLVNARLFLNGLRSELVTMLQYCIFFVRLYLNAGRFLVRTPNAVPDDRLPETGSRKLPIGNFPALRSLPRLLSRVLIRRPLGKYARLVPPIDFSLSEFLLSTPLTPPLAINFSRWSDAPVSQRDTAVENCVSYSTW